MRSACAVLIFRPKCAFVSQISNFKFPIQKAPIMATQTKTKSPPDKISTMARNEIADAINAVIAPFGWTVDRQALAQLQVAELDNVNLWLEGAFEKTPLAVWSVITIPNPQWIKFFKNKNDAMAIVSTVLNQRGEFNSPIGDPVARLIDNIDESGHVETRFGAMFLEATPELQIWFGRKAGKTPTLWGDGARNAINTLFNVPVLAEEKPKAESGKPKARNSKSQISNSKPETQPTLSMVPISDIIPADDNHRKTFDKSALQELADSIKQHGILQPLLLRLTPDAHPAYQIIAGERRFRAAQLAGLTSVPAQIVERDGLPASLAMLEENVRRVDLSPIERANAIQSLIDLHGLTQKEVGQMLGVTQGQVSNELRLLDLPPTLQAEVASGAIAPYLIRPALRFADVPDVLESLTASLLSEDGPHTEDRVARHLSNSILAASRSMQFNAHWQPYDPLSTEDRHFTDFSAKDLKRLDVRKCDALGGEERAFNVAVFDELNEAPLSERTKAKAALKAKNKADKSSPTASKKKPADVSYIDNAFTPFTLERAIEADMNRLLAAAIEQSRDKAAVLRIVLAFAVATEGAMQPALGARSAHVKANQNTPAVIDSLTGSAADMHATLRAATIATLRTEECLSVEECYCYAAVLGMKLWEHWLVTPEVLALLTAAGRAEFDDHEPGFIPDFLRPFFALQIDQPTKSKKGKAA